LAKNKRFIYLRYLSIKYLLASIKTLHERACQITESDLTKYKERNLYQISIDWLFDVLQFGGMSTVFLYSIIEWQGILKTILMVFSFGFIPHIIKRLRETILSGK